MMVRQAWPLPSQDNIESVKVMCMLVWGKKFTCIKQGEKKSFHEEVPGAYKSTYSGHLT